MDMDMGLHAYEESEEFITVYVYVRGSLLPPIQIHRDQTLRRSEILQRSAIPDQTLRSAVLDCF